AIPWSWYSVARLPGFHVVCGPYQLLAFPWHASQPTPSARSPVIRPPTLSAFALTRYGLVWHARQRSFSVAGACGLGFPFPSFPAISRTMSFASGVSSAAYARVCGSAASQCVADDCQHVGPGGAVSDGAGEPPWHAAAAHPAEPVGRGGPPGAGGAGAAATAPRVAAGRSNIPYTQADAGTSKVSPTTTAARTSIPIPTG